MAVSKALVPILKGEAATSLLETLSRARLKPYSAEEKEEAERRLEELLQERKNKK